MKRVQGTSVVDRLTSAAGAGERRADAAVVQRIAAGRSRGDGGALRSLRGRRILSGVPDRERAGRCGRRRAGSLHPGVAAGGPVRRRPGIGGRLAAEHRPDPRDRPGAREPHTTALSADRRADRARSRPRKRIRSSRRSGASAPSACARRSHRWVRRSGRRSTWPTSAGSRHGEIAERSRRAARDDQDTHPQRPAETARSFDGTLLADASRRTAGACGVVCARCAFR